MVTSNMEKFFDSSFHQKMESVQYKTFLAITGARKGVSEEELYDKLGLEPLQLCRWFRKSCHFYKSYKNEFPQHLFKLVNLSHFPYNAENIPLFKTNIIFSKILFSFSCYLVEQSSFGKSEALVFLKSIS